MQYNIALRFKYEQGLIVSFNTRSYIYSKCKSQKKKISTLFSNRKQNNEPQLLVYLK